MADRNPYIPSERAADMKEHTNSADQQAKRYANDKADERKEDDEANARYKKEQAEDESPVDVAGA